MYFEKWGSIVSFVIKMGMKRDSDGYIDFIAAVRKYCSDQYRMNLEDVGELKRLRAFLPEQLSVSTLQRIFLGINKNQKRVNDSTLKILAQFMVYESVDDYIFKNNGKNTK